jgi:hypothetical protein
MTEETPTVRSPTISSLGAVRPPGAGKGDILLFGMMEGLSGCRVGAQFVRPALSSQHSTLSR